MFFTNIKLMVTKETEDMRVLSIISVLTIICFGFFSQNVKLEGLCSKPESGLVKLLVIQPFIVTVS